MTDAFASSRLDRRTAISTGSGPGVGEHVAKAYAAGGEAIAVTTDVTVRDDLDRSADHARAAFHRIEPVLHLDFGPVTTWGADA